VFSPAEVSVGIGFDLDISLKYLILYQRVTDQAKKCSIKLQCKQNLELLARCSKLNYNNNREIIIFFYLSLYVILFAFLVYKRPWILLNVYKAFSLDDWKLFLLYLVLLFYPAFYEVFANFVLENFF